MSLISILVADPQNLVAEAVAGVLERYPDLFVHQSVATSGAEAARLAQEWQPNVVVMEYWMDDMEAPAAITGILRASKKSKILVYSWLYGRGEIQKSLDAGAAGFLPKSLRVEQLAEAIRMAQAGHRPVFAEQLKELIGKLKVRQDAVEVDTDKLATLTARELEVLKLLADGRPLDDVAKALLISRSTLKVHINSILRKTGTRKHAEAVAMALRTGWIRL